MGQFEGLEGKVVVVTGGASGIGLAAVHAFAEEGGRLLVVDLDEAAGTAAAAAVGGRFVRANVGQPADWGAVTRDAEDSFGGIDIAFLNAGVTTGESDVTALSDEQYRRVMSANVDGVVFGTRAVVPAMVRRGGGSIVVTASLASLIAFPPDPIYTLTKHAVAGFVRSVAPHLSAQNVTINAVNPGVVDTPLVGDARQLLQDAGLALIRPQEVASQVLRLATVATTGECWVIRADGEPARYDWAPPAGMAL